MRVPNIVTLIKERNFIGFCYNREGRSLEAINNLFAKVKVKWLKKRLIVQNLENKKGYVVMIADLIHSGQLNIIRKAWKYGAVIVGLLTNSAIASYKRLPYPIFPVLNAWLRTQAFQFHDNIKISFELQPF